MTSVAEERRTRLADCGGLIVVMSDTRGLSAARRKVAELAEELDLSADESDNLLMAAGEALSNAYEHGRSGTDGFISLGWRLADGIVTIRVESGGAGPESGRIPTRKAPVRLIHGNGIPLMRCHFDEVALDFSPNSAVVLRKAIR